MNFKRSIFLIFFFSLLFSFQKSNAQNIELTNPSFEDFPHPGHAPRGWMDCGQVEFTQETPPDVHPAVDTKSSYGVDLSAIDGNTYLGFVVRENESYESVAQVLKSPFQKGKCYSFNIHLARSHTYLSSIRGAKEKVSFTDPLILRVWGGNKYCEKQQLLFESDEVDNIIWEKFTFNFTSEEEFRYIKLEAYYNSSTSKFPNGNLLLDNASAFQLIACDNVKMESKMVREKIDLDEFKSYQLRKKNLPKKTIQTNIVFDELSSIRKKITPLARKVKFKKNILTRSGQTNLDKIANEISNSSKFKLIIDFDGLDKDKVQLRTGSILKLFNGIEFPKENYEVRNSKEEDGRVIWFVENGVYNLGVMERA